MEASTARSYTTQVSPNVACTHVKAITTFEANQDSQVIHHSDSTNRSLYLCDSNCSLAAGQDTKMFRPHLRCFTTSKSAFCMKGLPRKHAFLCCSQVHRTTWCGHHVMKVLAMPIHTWGSYQDDLPHRRCVFQPAPDGDSHNACLGCSQQDQQHKGSHDSLVHAVTAEAKSDIRHSLEMSHHINGARWVPCEVHSGIPACHMILSDQRMRAGF